MLPNNGKTQKTIFIQAFPLKQMERQSNLVSLLSQKLFSLSLVSLLSSSLNVAWWRLAWVWTWQGRVSVGFARFGVLVDVFWWWWWWCVVSLSLWGGGGFASGEWWLICWSVCLCERCNQMKGRERLRGREGDRKKKKIKEK